MKRKSLEVKNKKGKYIFFLIPTEETGRDQMRLEAALLVI